MAFQNSVGYHDSGSWLPRVTQRQPLMTLDVALEDCSAELLPVSGGRELLSTGNHDLARYP